MMGEHDVGRIGREGLGDGEADALGAAGDQSELRMAGKASSGSFVRLGGFAGCAAPRPSRAGRLARQDGLRDGAVLVQLFLAVERGDVGLELHAQEMDLHERQDALEGVIAADVDDDVVEDFALAFLC
jgi:hypothetical protein